MTSRIPGLRQVPEPNPSQEEAQSIDPRTGREDVTADNLRASVPITEAMVDEAVSTVVKARGLPLDQAEVMRSTLGRDTLGPLMKAYFTSKGAAARTAVTGVMRKDLVISQVLTDEEILNLTDYAPEFKLKFHNRDAHDHAMAAATRIVDHKLIASRLPTGVRTSDIGGNPLVYIKNRQGWVHTCGPEVDVKDPMRHKMRRMEARQLEDSSADSIQRSLARKYLDADLESSCGRMAQDCDFESPVAISIHVYDIPMRDWPAIMTRKRISVVEGCLLFSDRFFEQTEGELGISGARFEIDVGKDKFRMGFRNSPSWWYEHSFSQYILYGTDQNMVTAAGVFTYKITERRGDTLFFRILRTDVNRLSFSSAQVAFKTPGIPMVRVSGFELSQVASRGRERLIPKDYFFPRNLWYEMVSQASEDFERGVMDYNKMYNHYRTISVRHTINAVLVMGGERVSADELVPLVVHSCLAAAASCLIGQRETRALTDAEMKRRLRAGESTGTKVLVALRAMATSAVLAPFYPLYKLGQSLQGVQYDQLASWVMEWQPVQEITTLEVVALAAGNQHMLKAVSAEDMLRDVATQEAPFDHFAALVQDESLRGVAEKLCPQVQWPKAEQSPVDESVSGTTAVPSTVRDDRSAMRVAAIAEHIEETRMQNRAIASTCAGAYRDLCSAGLPNRTALMRKAELYRNPDFWRVENGIMVESALGLSLDTFNFSAVYHPTPDPDTDQCVRSVYSADWTGVKHGTTEEVTNKNYVIAEKEFSGWVMVIDDLQIYNGPEIVSSLEKALKLPHDYDVMLKWGPPGCGKTYQIIHEAKPDGSDVIMCPVRQSIEDTRKELLKLHGQFEDPKLRVRTVDSYLVNLGVQRKTIELRAKRLLADECFMAHAGKWYAAAALLGVEKIYAYGDDFQIPHIPRVQAPKLHVKLRYDERVEMWTTRRCPRTAVAAWGGVYDWKVRSLGEADGEMVEVRDTRGMSVPKGCVMMCMYQADKKELKKLYASELNHIKIITANEAEGKTYKHVWMHRFDNRKRSDKSSLFDAQPHVLVAMSRHTETFLYRCPADLGDLISQWIVKSKDPRRIMAAADVETAGEEMEFSR